MINDQPIPHFPVVLEHVRAQIRVYKSSVPCMTVATLIPSLASFVPLAFYDPHNSTGFLSAAGGSPPDLHRSHAEDDIPAP